MVVGEGMNATDHISVDKGIYGGFQLEIQLANFLFLQIISLIVVWAPVPLKIAVRDLVKSSQGSDIKRLEPETARVELSICGKRANSPVAALGIRNPTPSLQTLHIPIFFCSCTPHATNR